MTVHDHSPHDVGTQQAADHDGADHEHSRHEGDVVALPGKPDLRQLRTQAKDLRRGVRRGNPADLATIRAHHPRGEALAVAPHDLTLRDAQLALARRYGFQGWNALVQNVGRGQVEDRDLHRFFGIELNNEVWALIDDGLSPDSDIEDRELALYGAYASLRHWLDAGNAANQARGEHLVSRTATAVGLPDLALRHALRCLELVEANPGEMAEWDAPFAHEALARALAATGEIEAGRSHRALAVELTAGLPDPEDRSILERELVRPPWFGLASTPR
jgi:hypothetical protein